MQKRYTNISVKEIDRTTYVDTGLQLKIRKNKKGLLSKRYYVVMSRGGKLRNIGCLGGIDDITLNEAIRQKNKMIMTFDCLSSENNITFLDFFNKNMRKIPEFGKKDRQKYTLAHCAPIFDTPMRKISKKDVILILEKIVKKGHTGTLEKLKTLLISTFRRAKFKDLMADSFSEDIIEFCKEHQNELNKKGSYGAINRVTDLKKLLHFVLNQENIDAKNQMKISILTGLRPQNVRMMKDENICYDKEEWGYYLRYGESETKKERIEFLGITQEIYDFLRKCKNNKNTKYIFIGFTRHKPYCENFLRKILKGYTPEYLVGNQRFTPHSLRKLISTFANEFSKYSSREIEQILWHRESSQVQKVYDASTGIHKTREIINFWLSFLNQICLELGFRDGFLKS